MFDRVVCVTLERRPDRWQAFLEGIPGDWPFPEVEKFLAIDGKKCPRPGWWRAGGGAWGCYQSHLAIIQQCLQERVKSVLILEDDAVFCDGFSQKVMEFFQHVPDDWGMIYLGGQHLMVKRYAPEMVNNHVYRPYNVNRTHAFAMGGQGMRAVYQHLHAGNWRPRHHIDHHLGRLHMAKTVPVYCPQEWLVGQGVGKSNVSGRQHPERFWPSADMSGANALSQPFVAVLGLHSSGSSCLAGCLYHLGIHMGNVLGGYYGNDPQNNCGFEAAGLTAICEAAFPFPTTARKIRKQKLWLQLRKWINQQRREASKRKTIAGGKYPHLCQMGDQLKNICGDQLYVVAIDRPIAESIASLKQRVRKQNADLIEHHQTWLLEGKEAFLESLPETQKCRIDYCELLNAPGEQINRLLDFLPIEPSEAQKATAAAWVDPDKRHVHAPQ